MTARRFTDKPDLDPGSVRGLPEGHPAMVENRTLFPSTVVTVDEKFTGNLLVSGKNNRKLGETITKGKFKGFSLFGLSLEERATCPLECGASSFCYGNGMQMARRHRIGDLDVFASKLEDQVRGIIKGGTGLMARLHVLGDFHSVEYVGMWADLLEEHQKLAAYGYTHRRTKDDIGQAIQAVKDRFPDRFRIRWSHLLGSIPDSATIIDYTPKTARVEQGLVCPAQTDATACCASCGLCWESAMKREAIVFIKHGPKSMERAAETAMAPPAPAAADDFGALVTAALPKLRANATKFVRSAAQAEDLVQDTVVRALAARDQFKPGTNLMAWLVTIMRNHAYDKGRNSWRSVEDVDGAKASLLVSPEDAAGKLEAEEGLALFEGMEPGTREVMRDIALGLSYDEAAAKHGIAVGTVKSRVGRGRALLAGMVNDETPPPAAPKLNIATRPVRAIQLPPSLSPATGVGKAPRIKMVPPQSLIIEAAYQRDLSGKSIKLIRKIVETFDWAKMKPPVCAETADGLFVIDGQHTAIAAASHPSIKEIPVLIVEAALMENRAAAFVSHNRDRLVMTKAQIFYGDLAAGDRNAKAVMEVCAKVGASVPRLPVNPGYWKRGQVSAVGELRQLVRAAKPEVVERILRIAVQSEVAPISNTILRGLREIMIGQTHEYPRKKPDVDFVAAIRSFTNVEKAAETAAGLTGKSRYMAFAQLIADKVR